MMLLSKASKQHRPQLRSSPWPCDKNLIYKVSQNIPIVSLLPKNNVKFTY